MVNIQGVRDTLNLMVNEHYDTPEMLRFFSFSMTLPPGFSFFVRKIKSQVAQ